MTSQPENPSGIEDVLNQLQKGNEMPSELIEIFNEEAEDHLRAIYEGLSLLQQDSSNNNALLDVRRSSHTLKGAAGAVGLEAATRLSHRMEDLLDRLAENSSPVSETQLKLLLETADQLQELTTGEFDNDNVARQIFDLYKRFAEEFGEQVEADTPHGRNVSQACPSRTRETDRPTEAAGESATYLRVPMDRLDDLVSLLGEMIVNRSEFQQRLLDFSSRIEDMQSAMERLRNVARYVGSHGEFVHEPGTRDFSMDPTFQFQSEFDPLEFEQYDDSCLLEQSLAEADKDAEIMSREFQLVRSAFDVLLRRQQQLNREAQMGLMRIRMVPLSGIKSRLERTVRTVSGKLGRNVAFELVGEDIELDKSVLDAITDPIQHLIRNALDHGVEDADVRKAAGKPETASLRLEAVNEGTKILLRVVDDGAGIDLDKVRNKALQQGLIEDDQELTREHLHSLIFMPGFSTASELTEVSGRGVGMDVVGAAVSRLKGTICVNSEPGVGTTFAIELPTNVGVIRAMLVETQGRKFAIPMPSIHKVVRLSPDRVTEMDGEFFAGIDDRSIRVVDLAAHLDLSRHSREAFNRVVPMLILSQGQEQVAVTVHAIVGCQDIAVKSLGRHLKNVYGFNGATIGGDGAVIPILDSMTLIKHDGARSLTFSRPREFAAPVARKNVAMVIDDSISVRRVTENLLQLAGWEVVSAKDGVDALEKLAELDTAPDVFLSDMEMPRMDGLELIRQIREQQEFELTPIVMVTSRASEKHRQKAFEAGATEYVVKPFNEEQLLELIDCLVQSSREAIAV